MPFLVSIEDPSAITFVDAATIGGGSNNGGGGPVIVETRNGDFALTAADDKKVLLCSGGDAMLLEDASAGFSVTIVPMTATQVRFVGATVRHFQGHDATLAQYGVAGLLVIEPGVYLLTGATAAA